MAAVRSMERVRIMENEQVQDDDEQAETRLVYGWACDTCGAREVPLDPMFDEDDADRNRKNHECDTYWDGKDD